MGKFKCEYCGYDLSTTDETCPICGTSNPYFQRTVPDTPRTISELKDWYKARNLPPEDVTRFFIGTDYAGPKAYGIYRETNGEIVVYKNKSDGSRAVRYRGTDEEFAVNEIYLKLKSEILRQKENNIKKKESKLKSFLHDKTKKIRNSDSGDIIGKSMFRTLIIICIILSLVLIVKSAIISSKIDCYYLLDNNQIYYYTTIQWNDSIYEWWTYGEKDWEKLEITDDENYKPFDDSDIRLRDRSASAIANYLGKSSKEIDIYNSKAFINAGHHRKNIDNNYYYCNNHVYYHLYDPYGNNGGWYLYEDNNWEYYCSDDDYEILDEELWYDSSSYKVYSDDGLEDEYGQPISWDNNLFEDSSWYKSYEEDYEDYKERQAKKNYNDDDDDYYSWDNDNDYDWDSNDYDWDSNDYDWDSDW